MVMAMMAMNYSKIPQERVSLLKFLHTQTHTRARTHTHTHTHTHTETEAVTHICYSQFLKIGVLKNVVNFTGKHLC